MNSEIADASGTVFWVESFSGDSFFPSDNLVWVTGAELGVLSAATFWLSKTELIISAFN